MTTGASASRTDYTVAVWVGNFEGDSMHDVCGVTGAAPAWQEIMQALHEDQPSRPPHPPQGVVAESIEFVPARRARARAVGSSPGRSSRASRSWPGRPATARIASPANGTTIALDPDIPPANQVVILEGRGADATLALYLDGRRVGSADRPRRWRPVPGDHRVELRTADGRVRDSAVFTVRGSELPHARGGGN